jgi:pyruvate/2-oxoglutarate dehydrogenase complex dihydrolipoamide dehydrogenase (E3) component
MSSDLYDLVVIGAGSGGLVAARFAAKLGSRVALVEKDRIGGDCTWSGCVPSKALIKVAKVAHTARTASRYGVLTNAPSVDMTAVRAYVRGAIRDVYQFETPEQLQAEGVDVIHGAAQFVDAFTIAIGDQVIRAKNFLLTTGARPFIPSIAGLGDVPFVTYENIFDNDVLPKTMIIVGAGPVGVEIAQAYQRLGAQVTVVAERLLPKEDRDVQDKMRSLLEGEGIRFVLKRARSVRRGGDDIAIAAEDIEVRGNLLLVAAGRRPVVEGLGLDKAGVQYSRQGIAVDGRLRTNVKHIFAAGDVTGGYQFTHYSGWQAFEAVRNALLPGSSAGTTDLVPWVTFTDPEVAHIGLSEEEALARFGGSVRVQRLTMDRVDRAVCDNDTSGFIKVITKDDAGIVGGTIIAARAGEAIVELIVAIKKKMKAGDLAGAIHPYPTYSTAVQQMTADIAVDDLLSGTSGKVVRALSRMVR